MIHTWSKEDRYGSRGILIPFLSPCSHLKIVISFLNTIMPKEIKDVRDFVIISRRKDASLIKIKKNNNGETKFKVRCSKYLYTFVVKDAAKAEKLAKALPPNTPKEQI